MWVKVVIIILFVSLVLSLSGGFLFLLRDFGVPESKRTLYALGTRITLAIILMSFIGFQIQSGNLTNTAPWDQTYTVSKPAAGANVENSE